MSFTVAYYAERGLSRFETRHRIGSLNTLGVDYGFHFNEIVPVEGGDIPESDGDQFVPPVLQWQHLYYILPFLHA